MNGADGLSLEQLVASTRSSPVTMADVLREEVAAGRVEVVRSGSAVFRLTPRGRRQLEPMLSGAAGLTAIREPR